MGAWGASGLSSILSTPTKRWSFQMENKQKERPIDSYPHMTMAEFFSKYSGVVPENDEFVVDGEISAADLRGLLKFNNEFAITESANRLIITAGSEHHAGNSDELRERRYSSKLSLHTHPAERGVVYDFISDADIDSAGFGDRIPLVLVHEKGIILYQKPTKDPDTGENTDKYANDLLTEYLNKRGFARMATTVKYHPEMKLVRNLPENEKKALVVEFAHRSGMILVEAGWEESAKISDILKIINLRK